MRPGKCKSLVGRRWASGSIFSSQRRYWSQCPRRSLTSPLSRQSWNSSGWCTDLFPMALCSEILCCYFVGRPALHWHFSRDVKLDTKFPGTYNVDAELPIASVAFCTVGCQRGSYSIRRCTKTCVSTHGPARGHYRIRCRRGHYTACSLDWLDVDQVDGCSRQIHHPCTKKFYAG